MGASVAREQLSKSGPFTIANREIAGSQDLVRVELTESDIPGAALSDLRKNQTIPEFCW